MLGLHKTCCICGGAAYGKQWWNRDNGYGICDTCAVEQEKVESPETMKSYYGIRGTHYCVKSKTKQEDKTNG